MSGPVEHRAADLRRLADESWDLLVVGGGIVGAGALLDAASRGLKVALVEQDDIAAGTSSRSSRLIHGGLRYLAQFDFLLVREALHERARLLELAPHLVRLESFLFPLYGPPVATRAWYRTGMTLYDVLGSARSGGRHRALSKPETLEYAPDLVQKGLRGALLYHDAMEDDARYALAVVRTALAEGGAPRSPSPACGQPVPSTTAGASPGHRSRTVSREPRSTSAPPRCWTRRASGAHSRTGRSGPGRSACCRRGAATW